MPSPRARLYDLALRALDEQSQRVAQVHGRIAPILAAAGVGITLLGPRAFAGPHPSGRLEAIATTVGILGLMVLVLASAYVLRPRRLSYGPTAGQVLMSMRAHDPRSLDDVDRFHERMVLALTRRKLRNEPEVNLVATASGVAVYGLVAELGGLSLAAALAS